ncbi:MAG: SDR family NAD(P)-dependent oxidoreductase [Chloroflexi bacterium]|nr:SDR family NAD(P)-dependent oxidoreductase [Chloroflexota bacterium]
MAHVLVTGGAGFIGSHTVERLLHDGHRVTALDNLSTGTWANLRAAAGSVECIEADVRDAAALAALVRASRFDAIIHLAAWSSVAASLEHPAETHAINVGGCLNVLEAAREGGVGRVVVASSAAVYGRSPVLPSAETALPQPMSPYAAHKAECELLCSAYRVSYGLEGVPLRYFNVYGRRQPAGSPYSGFVAIAAHRLASGEPIAIHGDGEQSRDFIHVSDVAAVNVRAALGPDPGDGPINVAGGTQTSIMALLAALRTILRADAAIRFGPERTGDVRHSRADITRLRDRLGYTPRASLEEGLRELLGG